MENLQGFFESTLGQITTVAVIVIVLFLILRGNKDEQKKTNTKALTISALSVALSVALGMIKVFEMPQGGAVTLVSMLPIAVCGYLLGTRRAVMAGICVGLLNLILDPYVVHPAQLLIDYPLAFGALGLSGLMRNRKNGLLLGFLVGLLGRYFCAVLSGIIFFGDYAAEGFNAVTWSFWYNLTYLGVDGLITVVVISLPPIKSMIDRLKGDMVTAQ